MAKLACECVLMCMCLLTVQIIQENRGGGNAEWGFCGKGEPGNRGVAVH